MLAYHRLTTEPLGEARDDLHHPATMGDLINWQLLRMGKKRIDLERARVNRPTQASVAAAWVRDGADPEAASYWSRCVRTN